MKKTTIKLRDNTLAWATFGDLRLSVESPSVELNEEDANALLSHPNAHLLELVSEHEEAGLTKEQLQALYIETIGADPDKRLSPAKLQQAIDDYNAAIPDTSTSGLSDVVVEEAIV